MAFRRARRWSPLLRMQCPDSEIPLSVDEAIEGRLAADETLWVERVRDFAPLTCINVSS